MGIGDRLQQAWNVFRNKEPLIYDYGPGYSYRPDKIRFTRGNEKSIITSVYNRIAIDTAAIQIEHVYIDEEDQFISSIDSGLNTCFSLEANMDQSGRAFIQDVVMSMMDEGCVALVPIDIDVDDKTGAIDILSIRTGKILEWYPTKVKVRVYNDRTGVKEDVIIDKEKIAIIENPMYAIMNEPNSTMQRLIRKLNLLDVIDEQSGSGKLDLIIKLPYVIRSPAKKEEAEKRRKEIEMQLSDTKYGIAYTDGTENITQLNRPVNNNLMSQIEYLTSMLYSQLGITQSILDGTADSKTMLNYYNRTIEPMISAIVNETKRRFISKEDRKDKQSIKYFRDIFLLASVSEIAEIGDKFTRNEILSSNEMRQIIGRKPSRDPRADELRNKNLNAPAEETSNKEDTKSKEEIQNE